MLIGIDASRANRPNRTGVEWYCYHLIQALKKLTQGDRHQWVLYTREPLRDGLERLPENWYEMRAGWPPKYLWTQVRMSWEMMRRPSDILFVPAHVFPPIHPEKTVVTVHDIGFKRMPHLYKHVAKRYHVISTNKIVKSSARIVTPSEFCGREIVDVYGVDPSRIAITHLGIDHGVYRPVEDYESIERTLALYHIARPYFFFIGRLEEKKNIVNLIKAFDAFKAQRGYGDPTMLVLAGPEGYGFGAISAQIEASPNKAQILRLGYVPEEHVPILTSAALGYVHIAWYEGFGIPPVQAMACGCPVIAANNSCLPEILGEGNAIFVAPDDVDATARAMDRLVSDPTLVLELRRKGIEQASKYTWEATAQETLPVLTEWL